MNDKPPTHKEVVRAAKLWLLRSKRCNPVFAELGSNGCGEFPDVIGWDTEHCYLIECKVSIPDFHADKFKASRSSEIGLGSRRFYCMPRDVYEKVRDSIPPSWGHLIYERMQGEIVRQERLCGGSEFPRDSRKEVAFLRSRILQIQRFGCE